MTTSKTIDLSLKDQSTIRKLGVNTSILCSYLELLRSKISIEEDIEDIEDIETHIINCYELSTIIMEYSCDIAHLGKYQ